MTNPVDHIALQAMLRPDQLAVVDLTDGRRWSYATLNRLVAQWAALLKHDFAVGPGERVALLAKNRAEAILMHFACARIGAIFVPFNWRLSSRELAALMDDVRPRLIAGDAELAHTAIAGLRIEEMSTAAGLAEPLPQEAINPRQPSLMLFTSGTSGHPKGALLSEWNLLQAAVNFGLLTRVTPESVFLVDSPMFHIMGLVSCVRSALMQGGTILVSDGFEPARTLLRLGDPALGVTHYFCVPQMAQLLRTAEGFNPEKLLHLTALFTGGAPLAPAEIDIWLKAGIAIVNGFGMSETATVFGMPVDQKIVAAKPGSVGVATPGIGARIVDDEGRECDDGVAGELLLKGENIFAGYWQKPEESAEAFTEDGWFRTGDIAMRDADGFHWIVDRKKDMFISGGENVYPAEIESALAGYPGLSEFAVVGVPDERWGEVGHLVIVAAPESKPNAQAILEFLRNSLAHYKVPKHLSFRDRLPRTSTGKIQKKALRADLLLQR